MDESRTCKARKSVVTEARQKISEAQQHRAAAKQRI